MTELLKPHITQYYRKNDASVDFKYICIKKEHFDSNMIYLNYKDVKKSRYIEIIYKSPSAFLEGLFFKTPVIKNQLLTIVHKDAYNNVNIKFLLNYKEHANFIQILRQIDEYLSAYLTNNIDTIKKEILNIPDQDDDSPTEDKNTGSATQIYKYEPILRFKHGGENVEVVMKSYLDKHSLSDLEMKFDSRSYIFTFNISNIYFGQTNLVPLVKCNRCELV